MRYYPAFLDLKGRLCLVIGAGELAEQKAATLQGAGARVKRAHEFRAEEACDAFLIVAVLEDRRQGARLKRFADKNRILLNVVDQAENCSFIAPAVLERGDLLIAVSTSGKSPALAARIRSKLEQQFGAEWADWVEALGRIRPLVRRRFPSFEQRKNLYRELVKLDLRDTLRSGGAKAAWAELERRVLEKAG